MQNRSQGYARPLARKHVAAKWPLMSLGTAFVWQITFLVGRLGQAQQEMDAIESMYVVRAASALHATLVPRLASPPVWLRGGVAGPERRW